MSFPQTRAGEHEALREAIEERLDQAVTSIAPTRLRASARHVVEGGKRIRPLLTLMACGAAGGRPLDAIEPAVAVELLHVASLVHDDIMDGADLRRGRSTLHVLHGVPAAILTGDALVALAFQLLASSNHPNRDLILREFSSTYLALCEGQSDDIDGDGARLLDSAAHDDMVRKKTAELLGSALALGAMSATRDASLIGSLRQFGVHLGMAYQAKDDLLEITGDERGLGKRPGADARNGRRTYLTMAYPEVDTAAGVHLVVSEQTGAALRELGNLPPSPWRDQCEAVARMLAEREA